MLWEALAGKHPFRSSNAAGTTRRIQAGAPPLETVRPDLPRAAPRRGRQGAPSRPRAAADRRRSSPPSCARSRASAAAVPGQAEVKAPKAPPRELLAVGGPRARRARPLAAAVWTGWVASALPFYPPGWPLGLTIATAALGLAFPRVALAVRASRSRSSRSRTSRSGSRSLFAALGAVWMALTWNDPRGNVALVAGPLLGPARPRSRCFRSSRSSRAARRRRALQAVTGALLAVVVAGLRRQIAAVRRLARRRSGSGSPAASRPSAVAWTLWRTLADASGRSLGRGARARRRRGRAALPARARPLDRRGRRRGAPGRDRRSAPRRRRSCRSPRPPGSPPAYLALSAGPVGRHRRRATVLDEQAVRARR